MMKLSKWIHDVSRHCDQAVDRGPGLTQHCRYFIQKEDKRCSYDYCPKIHKGGILWGT